MSHAVDRASQFAGNVAAQHRETAVVAFRRRLDADAAQALDLAGKRNDALIQYRAVLARPDVYDAHDQAQSGLKEAYKKKLT